MVDSPRREESRPWAALSFWLNWRNVLWLLSLAPAIAVFSFLVGKTWFICDDAFISFRYSRNIVDGLGIVFNRSDAVEGYTNFLWVLELAAIWKIFGVRPELASVVLSIASTVAVFALVAVESFGHRKLGRGYFRTWMSFVLLMTSTTFAAWTTSGLETRHFTMFVVAAMVSIGLYPRWKHGLWVASICAGLAELTRPEGLLLGAVCMTFVAIDALRRDTGWFRSVIEISAPFFAIVSGHFLFRYAYYGEWLPNTYYAKHVRPWFTSGFDYWVTAGIETGAYLWLPLALIGAFSLWRLERRLHGFLVLAFVTLHAGYLLKIGGDHFEFRPMDMYWPLLVPWAVDGIWMIARKSVIALQSRWRVWSGLAGIIAVLIWAVVAFYSGSIQAKLMLEARKKHPGGMAYRLDIALDDNNAKEFRRLPLMAMLNDIANASRFRITRQMVGARIQEHRLFALSCRYMWEKYKNSRRPLLPKDAVAAAGAIGVMPFFLPDLDIIDTMGLADKTVARNPVHTPNEHRHMAHDRRPPIGYLHERGVNFAPFPAVETAEHALGVASYALQVHPTVWFPFDARSTRWVEDNFDPKYLKSRHRLHAEDPAQRQITVGPNVFEPKRILGSFEEGWDEGWTHSGEIHVDHESKPVLTQGIILNRIGTSVINTFHPERLDAAVGLASFGPFQAEKEDWLVFFIAGGSSSRIGLRLMEGKRVIRSWSGSTHETLRAVAYPLTDEAGKDLHIEVFDHDTAAWGHIVVDHVMIARRKGQDKAIDPMGPSAMQATR